MFWNPRKTRRVICEMINRRVYMCEECHTLSSAPEDPEGITVISKSRLAKLVNADELFRCAVELSQTKAN